MSLTNDDLNKIGDIVDERIDRHPKIARIEEHLGEHNRLVGKHDKRLGKLDHKVDDLSFEVRKIGIEMEQRDHDVVGILNDIRSSTDQIPELRKRIEALEARPYFG